MDSYTGPVPMTVIGGFLGAGKTTLLNHLLAHPGGVRYAVLVNDFGDLAVDGALVSGHGGETVTFTNGCVCCTLGDGLMATVDSLLAGPAPPEQFLVEASGVSDPRAIADQASLHPDLARDLTLVLADAESIRTRAADPRLADTVERQLRAADLVVLNKCDRVDAATRDDVCAWIRTQCAAKVVPCVAARLPAGVLQAAPRVANAAPAAHAHDTEHDPGTTFRSVTLACPGALDETRLRQAFSRLGDRVLRAKGFVRTLQDPQRLSSVQVAASRVAVAAFTRAAEPPPARLTVIGLDDLPDAGELAALLGIEAAQPACDGHHHHDH